MARTSKPWQRPGVVFNPAASRGLQKGIEQLVSIVRPTLGPLPRLTVDGHNVRTRRPELLDDGAVIARRLVQLPDRDADMGAMYLRQLLWKIHETVGDGTATAAVLFHVVYKESVRYLVAGGNLVGLRKHLEAATRFLLTQLEPHKLEMTGSAKLSRLAETICGDAELSSGLGEIFSLIGPDGRLEIRSGRTRDIQTEYSDGSYWNSGLFSRHLITDQIKVRAELENAAVLVTDLDVNDTSDLIPVLDAAFAGGYRSLMLIARTFPDAAVPLMTEPKNRSRMLMAAAKTPGVDINEIRTSVQDIALLTGGRALLKDAGDTFQSVRAEHLGRARRVWADMEYLGIANGQGDAAAVRQAAADLRHALKVKEDKKERALIKERLSNLVGGTGILWVGALSPYLVDVRKNLAAQTADALREAVRSGGLPGGGVALLDCRPALRERMAEAKDMDERMAYQILLKAVEAPARAIWENAGHKPGEVFSQLENVGPGYGLDVVRRQVVHMTSAGIYDSAGVVREIVMRSVMSASLALTVDVLIHKAQPIDSSVDP